MQHGFEKIQVCLIKILSMTTQATNATARVKNLRGSYVFPLIVIGALFFIFGFVTWANSQLIPYLKIACELTDTQSFLVATAFFAAYFIMAIPSSAILKWTGFKKGMSRSEEHTSELQSQSNLVC